MDIVEDAVEAIIRSGGDEIGALADDYRARDLQPPTVVLAPTPDAVPLATHRQLLQWWAALPRSGELPAVDHIAPEALREYLGRLILLDPVDGGADLRYRLYGSIVAQFVGTDLTGRLVSETYAMRVWPDSVTNYYLVTYRAALRARQPVYSVQRLSEATSMHVWHRLLLPFAEAGEPNRLLLLSVPCDSEGKPLPAWRTAPG